MANRFELDEILASNPHIDPNLLEQSKEILNKLREAGVKKAGYNLASPYARRRNTPSSIGSDPRVVHLRRSSRRT